MNRYAAAAIASLTLVTCAGSSSSQEPATPSKPAQTAAPAAAPAAEAAAAPAAAPSPADKPLSEGELDQLVAPIALYPDDLIAQILMASTYPLEIVEAARWAKQPANAKLKGAALDDALDAQDWDPSVKSLVPFPTVLENMDAKLDWTQKLGDAFLGQQKDVMDAIQRLRLRAKEAGNLESNDKQTVTTETAPGSTTQTIIIQPAQPQVIYVPTYQTTVVYGTWGYPAYPPYYWPPPPGAVFMAGFVWGAAVAGGGYYGWGHCGWHGGDVDIDVNHNWNVNRPDRPNRPNAGNRPNGGSWRHDPTHRKGVNYKDASTRDKYGKGQAKNVAARDSFRGRTPGADRPGATRPGASDLGGRGTGAAGGRPGQSRPGGSVGGSTPRTSRDVGTSARSSGAFDRSGGASAARASSARGNASMGSARGGGFGGGGMRGGGGGRGGGGRR